MILGNNRHISVTRRDGQNVRKHKCPVTVHYVTCYSDQLLEKC